MAKTTKNPVKFAPSSPETILINSPAFNITAKADATISASLNATKVNIGENANSMAGIIIGACVVAFLGGSFKASASLINVSCVFSKACVLSNYASIKLSDFEAVGAQYNNIVNEHGMVTNTILTALNHQQNIVKHNEFDAHKQSTYANLTAITNNTSEIATSATQITNNRTNITNKLTELTAKKHELENLVTSINTSINELTSKKDTTAASVSIASSTDNSPGMHTYS